MIKIEHLNKSFENISVLKDINLEITKGDIIAVVGPSGTGKSTLLRCINYLTPPTSGKIIINNIEIDAKHHRKKDILALRKHISMVFQNYNLFKNKTAIENVMEPLITVYKMKKNKAYEIALNSLKKVGLEDKQNFYPSKLSGGQQQRVGIARAIAVNPNIILFDEPTSALDPELVGEVLRVINTLAFEGSTMIIVTHEIEFAKHVANKVVFMDKGTISAIGTPKQILENPKDYRIKQFLNILDK